MSSAVGSTSAALGRPFLFDDDAESGGAPVLAAFARNTDLDSAAGDLKKPAGKELSSQEAVIARVVQFTIKSQQSAILPADITPASRLELRPAPEMASSGIPEIDTLIGGFPRGCLTEICGPASSGRTSMTLAALAAATRRGEFCALIDASDALDPHSVAAAGVDLDRFLWVRCGDALPRKHGAPDALVRGPHASRRTSDESEHRLEQVLRATDLLLESGGFGLIILDLADIPPQSARRIPLATWFRFRRSVEHKPTILLAIEQQPIAGSCSSLSLQLQAAERQNNSPIEAAQHRKNVARGLQIEPESAPAPTHAQLLSGLQIHVERIRSRLDRKPAQSVTFETKTAWAG